MSNLFPETKAKKYLRLRHYRYIVNQVDSDPEERYLVYFGLPSADMLDVQLWHTHLDHIFAVERDNEVVEEMYRTAGKLKIYKKLTIIERDLLECSKFLAVENDTIDSKLNRLNSREQTSITKLRKSFLDIIYLDMYGGFLYGRSDNTNTNSEILKNIFSHQRVFRKPFTLILTYNLRDTGNTEYDRYNSEFLNQLSQGHSVSAEKLKLYYLSESIKGHPISMRRLRLALPMRIMDLAKDSFEIASISSWIYGQSSFLFHTIIQMKPRMAGSLGVVWPPIDEVRRILSSPVYRLEEDEHGDVVEILLDAPTLSL